MNSLQLQELRCNLKTEFHRDLEWWHECLDVANSQCNCLHQCAVTSLQTDACTIGLGAFFKGDWFYLNTLVDRFPDFHINYKEAVCVLLSAARWCHTRCIKTGFVYCNNTITVAMLNKGTTTSSAMMYFLRGLLWLSDVFNFRIKAVHVAGNHNIFGWQYCTFAWTSPFEGILIFAG